MAIILLDNDSAGKNVFEPASAGIDVDPTCFSQERMLVPDEHRILPALTTEHRRKLKELMECIGMIPVTDPHPGRSLFARLRSDSGWPVPGLKFKGAGGLIQTKGRGSYDTNRWRCVPPQPDQQFQGTTHRMFLTKSLELKSEPVRQGSLMSMTAKEAQYEYDCYERLSRHRLSLRPLLAGAFQVNGKPENDCNGNPMGALALEHDPQFTTLTQQMAYFWVMDGDNAYTIKIVQSDVDTETMQNGAPWHFDNFIRIAELAQQTKRDTILLGITGHAGHADNYRVDMREGFGHERVLLSDMDTTKLLEDMDPKEKGPSMLLDFTQSIQHMIVTFTFQGWSRQLLLHIQKPGKNPFYSFLRGLFGGRVQEKDLANAADDLFIAYVEFIRIFHKELSMMATDVRSELQYEQQRIDLGNILQVWQFIHLKFKPHCLAACYKLMQASDFGDQGFTLKKMSHAKMLQQFQKGMDQHWKESDGDDVLAQIREMHHLP